MKTIESSTEMMTSSQLRTANQKQESLCGYRKDITIDKRTKKYLRILWDKEKVNKNTTYTASYIQLLLLLIVLKTVETTEKYEVGVDC